MIYMDIETGALPVAEREFARPDVEEIKMGNLKDPAKIKAKIDEIMDEWEVNGNPIDPTESRVAAIGYIDTDKDKDVQFIMGDERDILDEFWMMCNIRQKLVGHYIFGFDLPFMVKRSMLTGMDYPSYIDTELMEYLPNPEMVFDTMFAWGRGNKQDRISLQKLAGACGYTCKTGDVEGKYWWRDYQAGKKDECLAYLRDDVLAVKAVYEKLFTERA